MNKSIDIKEALQFGWDTLKANTEFFLKLLIVLVVALIVPTFVLGKIAASIGGLLALPLQLLSLVWQSILSMGVLFICLKLHDGKPVEISDLWACIPRTLDYIIVKFVVMVIVGIGLFLLIVPGLIWMMMFYLANYLVVDRGLGVIAALKGSMEITSGAKWNLGIFASVLLLVNIIGILCLGVGLIITLPISILASVRVYRKLLVASEAAGQTI